MLTRTVEQDPARVVGKENGVVELPPPTAVEGKLRRQLEAASGRERALLLENATLHSELKALKDKHERSSMRARQAGDDLAESELRERRMAFAMEKMQAELDEAKEQTRSERREARAQLTSMRHRVAAVSPPCLAASPDALFSA